MKAFPKPKCNIKHSSNNCHFISRSKLIRQELEAIMPRRKAGPCEAKPNSTNQLSPRLSLLSLPPEIRFMIWEYVLGNSVLLRSLIAAASVDPSKLSCLEYHAKALGQTENCSSLFEKRPGLLSWLRTNRQIHTEAQPLVYQNICLHVCFPMDLRHLLSFSTSTSKFRIKDIQCLSVCTNIGIYHDLHDGFTIKPPERNYQRDPFIPKHSLPMRCYGAWRWSQFDEDLPHDGKTLDERMPGLKEVRVRLYFTCLSHQVNNRPVIGQYKDGRPKMGQLYRPKNPAPLACQDNAETERSGKETVHAITAEIAQRGQNKNRGIAASAGSR